MDAKRFSYGNSPAESGESARIGGPTALARIKSFLPAGLARKVADTGVSRKPSREYAAEYFTINSFHSTVLSVHSGSGMVVCMPDGATDPGYLPVVGVRLEQRPDLLFLAADVTPGFRIGLQFSSFRSLMLPVHADPGGAENQVTLHDPLHGRFLSAPPIRSRDQLACVTASRDRVNDWERFQLVRLPRQEISPTLSATAWGMERLIEDGITADSILNFIANSDPADGDGTVLDGVLPLLGIGDLKMIADRLMTEPDLTSRLAEMSPDDAWAGIGIPQLARWVSGRRSAAVDGSRLRSRPEPRDEANQRTIGIELDRLATDGAGGQFASFAHACAIMARRAVQPRRTACIVMSARNEGIYLLEWIAYHRAVGFEHFFIYSNNNEDRSDELLSALADANVITWIKSELSPGVSAQSKAFGHAFGMLPEVLDFEWALVIDADEFFVPNPERFGSVNDFITWQKKREVDAVALNWRFLGSNDEVSCLDELMSRRNKRLVGIPLIGDGHRLIKSMFRPQRMLRSRSHTPVCDERSSFVYRLSTGDIHAYRNNPAGFHSDPGFSDLVNTENACIYHYFFKSAEEWLWKSSRNRGDHPMSVGIPMKMFTDEWIRNFMTQSDAPPEEFTNHVPVYSDRMDAQLAQLQSLPGVAESSETVKRAFRDRLEQIKTAIRASPAANELDETSRKFLELAGVF